MDLISKVALLFMLYRTSLQSSILQLLKDGETKARNGILSASFPLVLGDFGCDVTSGHSDSANWPGYEAGNILSIMPTSNCSLRKNDLISLTLTTFSLLLVALKSWPP